MPVNENDEILGLVSAEAVRPKKIRPGDVALFPSARLVSDSCLGALG